MTDYLITRRNFLRASSAAAVGIGDEARDGLTAIGIAHLSPVIKICEFLAIFNHFLLQARKHRFSESFESTRGKRRDCVGSNVVFVDD